jgi:hypothetical protein
MFEVWRKVDWLKKEFLLRKVITSMLQIFETRFQKIGSLYTTTGLIHMPLYVEEMESVRVRDTKYHLGNIIFGQFYCTNYLLQQDVPRGMSNSSRDWLAACFGFTLRMRTIWLKKRTKTQSRTISSL